MVHARVPVTRPDAGSQFPGRRAAADRHEGDRECEQVFRLPVTVTRRVTRGGGRHKLMDTLSVRARMIEDDHERDLVIVDGVIADAGPVPGTGPDAAGWVLPGLVDVHNHLSLASPAGDDQDADVRVRASASVELALGVLAVREPGSPDDASARLAREGGWPRVITAGRFLAPPGGYFPGLAREVTAAEMPPAAEQEARRLGEDHR